MTMALDTKIQQSEIKLLSKTESNILPIENHEKIRGGTFIIKDQALCPFKAFAKYRLHANEGIEEANDLTPLDRGLLIHRVLELFWQQVQSQQSLLALSENECDEIIDNCITEALNPLQEERPELFSDQTCDFERFRLSNLTQRWLVLEKQRPPFTVIAQEQWQSLKLGDLELNMRVDRIDQLDSGEKWVIDYKTGQPSPNDWFNERSPEPQLPLYALCDEEVTALVFSQLRSKDLRNKGVSADEYEVPGIKPIAKIKEASQTWQEQRNNGQQQLNNLADEFMQGDIRIAPQKPSTCQRCEFKRLCRINLQ